ncbi:MAG: hypothetical protein ACQESP_07455 [Candidatus Muiribacteriota bacterium]
MDNKIKNIGILDLRNTDKGTLKKVEKIENVGLLIYSKETKSEVFSIPKENIGVCFETDENCRIISGFFEIKNDYFKFQKEKVSLVVSGRLVINENVKVEEINNKVKKILLAGEIICAQELLSVISAKTDIISGKIKPLSQNSKNFNGKLIINNNFLYGLNNNTSLTVAGKLIFVSDCDKDLFNKKIKSVELNGKLEIAEKNFNNFSDKITGSFKTSILKEGFKIFNNDLVIDRNFLTKKSKIKIYSKGSVIIKPEVKLEKLTEIVTEIKAEEKIYCPASNFELLSNLIDENSQSVELYDGDIIVAEGDYLLTSGEIQFLNKKVNYFVKGILKFDKNISGQLISEKINSLFNYGVIEVCDSLYGQIQVITKVKKGIIINQDINAGQQNITENAGYLTL